MTRDSQRMPRFSWSFVELDGVPWDCIDIELEPALLVRRERDGGLTALSNAGQRALGDAMVGTAFQRLLALGHDVRIFPSPPSQGEGLRFAFNQLAVGAPMRLATERAVTLVCTLRAAAADHRQLRTVGATSYRASAVDHAREAAVAARDDADGRRAHGDYVLGWAGRLRRLLFGGRD